jgi:hypothetical protein
MTIRCFSRPEVLLEGSLLCWVVFSHDSLWLKFLTKFQKICLENTLSLIDGFRSIDIEIAFKRKTSWVLGWWIQ